MKSSKREIGKSRDSSDQLSTLHQRLYQALNLGIKSYDDGGRKWQCADIEIQRLAVRAISAFVGSISRNMLRHPLVKNSIGDMLLALEGAFQSRNEAVLGMAANVTVKLSDILGSSILSFNVLELVNSLSCLVSFHQSPIASSCAVALNQILLKLTPRRIKSQNEVWEILKEKKVVHCIARGLEDIVNGSKALEFYLEMTSLLTTILWQWPSSRWPVWSNAKLVEDLGTVCLRAGFSSQVAVLQLYSTLALCGTVAKKLLENGEKFLSMVVQCMGSSMPNSVRVEAFKLARRLAKTEQGCMTMMRMCRDSIIIAIVDAMSAWRMFHGKVATEQLPLLVEACHLAFLTRWPGDHHSLLWKLDVDRVLLDLLVGHFHKTKQSKSTLTMEELIAMAREGLNSNHLVVLRPYIWNVLGWLATNCVEDFNPEIHGDRGCLNILIARGCLILVDSLKMQQLCYIDASNKSKVEPACRAVLLMINSPCKYIACQTKAILSELLMPNVDAYLKDSFDCLNLTMNWHNLGVVNNLQTIINLIGLACILNLPKYRRSIIRSDGMKTLSTFIAWCVNNHASIVSHPQTSLDENTCCLDEEDWEGRNSLLFLSLWALSELMQNSVIIKSHGEVSGLVVDGVELTGFDVYRLIERLDNICCSSFSLGVICYATYILSFFNLYGCPSRLGKRIGKALEEKELADVQLRLSHEESLEVHGVILMVRCQSLLPPERHTSKEISGGSTVGKDIELRKFKREVRLSSRIVYQSLIKLLEFVYIGSVEVDDDLVKELNKLAKVCKLHALSRVLGRKKPKWGEKVLLCDYTPALGPTGYHFSDIILEANPGKVMDWSCSYCTLAMPHMHAHKIILSLSSDYMRAMFQSDMQESHSRMIKVPVSWEALSKLVIWFYSDVVPKPSSGCIWENMNVEQQVQELHPYVELCWLAEFWLLEDIREEALRMVVSRLNSSRQLSLKIIEIAANLHQPEIVEAAANYLAPSYPNLRDSGDLEALNEELNDIVRVSYVSLSQEQLWVVPYTKHIANVYVVNLKSVCRFIHAISQHNAL